MGDELPGRQSPFQEGEALYRMIGDEHTLVQPRELIAVPTWIERVLRAHALELPWDSCLIESSLKFRVAALEEFERLVREGVPITDLPEVEETELGASTETLSFHQKLHSY